MADLPFLDKLSEQQLVVADKIITKAQELGVDPRLALSLAYVESGLKMGKVGDAGEVGVMQVKPDTAKMLGVDAKGLRNEDTNIDVGMRYLKQGIDRYKDSQLGVVAYNAGHDAPFLLGKAEAPPASTLGYLNKINSIGGFEPTPQPEAAPAAPSAAPAPAPTPASEEDFRKRQAALGGAGIGASLGAATDIKRAIVGGPEPTAPRAGTPVQKWGQAMGYGDRGAQTFAQAHEFEQGTRKGAPIRSPATGQTFKPEFRVAKPPIIEPTPSPLQRMGAKATQMGEVMTKYPIASNTLAGAGAGFAGQDALQRYRAGDVPGAAIAGLGAAGSLASMIPHPLTKAVGTGISMASPAALFVLDKMREKSAGQPQPAAQP